MKVYSIGRDHACDIVLDDNTDVISRRHATLIVHSANRMTITDLSGNGTYVNGMRIAKNVPFPITRKDRVSFAGNVAVLDWTLVPKGINYILCGAIAAGTIIVLLLIGLLIAHLTDSDSSNPPSEYVAPQLKDQDKSQELKEAEERADSILKAQQLDQQKDKQPKKSSTSPKKKKEKEPAQPEETQEEAKPTPIAG